MVKHWFVAAALAVHGGAAVASGIHFNCAPDTHEAFVQSYADYLRDNQVPLEMVRMTVSGDGVVASLAKPWADVAPVDQFHDPRFGLKDERYVLPTGKPGASTTVLTASRKEILVGLMTPGRTTKAPCDIAALDRHVKERQSIAAWTERVYFGWPEGSPAKWNPKFWHKGTPHKKEQTVEAVADVFFQPTKYEVGCYTAAKLVLLQGVLQAASQPGHAERLAQITQTLWADGDPLVDLEPGRMWHMFPETSKEDLARPGKLLVMVDDVAPHHFVAGDWLYMLNPDPVSAEKTGYEGSNAIYLGRGKFSDYYNDRNHFFSYAEKLDEVYQWRNSVFNRTRHLHRVTPLTAKEVRDLGNTPKNGGLVMPYRVVRPID